MKGDDQKHERKEFPPEFKYLDEVIDEPIRRIHSLEKKLVNFDEKPVDKKTYMYNPPGFTRAKLMQSKALSKAQLEQLLDSQEKELNKQFKAQIWGIEPDEAAKLMEVFQDRRHPNPFDNMPKIEFEKARHMEKDTTNS